MVENVNAVSLLSSRRCHIEKPHLLIAALPWDEDVRTIQTYEYSVEAVGVEIRHAKVC